MKNIIEKIKSNENLQALLFLIGYTIALLFVFINLVITCLNPPTTEEMLNNMTVEERIRSERRIFP